MLPNDDYDFEEEEKIIDREDRYFRNKRFHNVDYDQYRTPFEGIMQMAWMHRWPTELELREENSCNQGRVLALSFQMQLVNRVRAPIIETAAWVKQSRKQQKAQLGENTPPYQSSYNVPLPAADGL